MLVWNTVSWLPGSYARPLGGVIVTFSRADRLCSTDTGVLEEAITWEGTGTNTTEPF